MAASHRVWRLAAANTHLYPGARLTEREVGAAMPERGDALVVEFADQRAATGEVKSVSQGRVAILVDAYVTAHGTAIARKAWTLARDPAAPDAWKVVRT
ncbi:MAG: hypothetical protein ABW276_02640 [Casimicrobiaceae bacterium]